MSEAQVISIRPHTDAVIAVLSQPRMDDAIIEQMQEQVTAAAAQGPALPVILDMSQVEYVPSMGLGALVGLMRRLRQDGHRFLLAGLQPEIRKLFAITRLDKLFEFRSNIDDALSHLRGGG
jgi:anti-sigma B factor antagonist